MTFIKDDGKLNTSQISTEIMEKLQECMEDLKNTKIKVDESKSEIGKSIKKLCEGWNTVCSELQEVSLK